MPLKVYYIEDEADLCEIFSSVFSRPELEIISFSDPVLAIEAINRTKPDIIFLDYRLPGMTGEELVQKVDLTSVPVVLMSGDLDVKTSFPYLRSICKQPFPWEEVSQILETMLSKEREDAQLD